jgi:TonB family protein
MNTAIRVLCASALLGASACAQLGTAATPREALLSDAAPRRDRPCRLAGEPRMLPSADALVDSAALAARLAALWREGGAPRGHVLLAMRFDPEGLNVRRDVLEHRLTPGMADSVQALVFALRRAAAPAEREWGVRLRVDLGEQPVFRVGRSETCAAALMDHGDDVLVRSYSNWGDVRDSGPPPAPTDAGMVWVRVALDPAGRVTGMNLERGVLRGPIDRRLMQYVMQMAFSPATVDGYPVPGEASIPLRLGR